MQLNVDKVGYNFFFLQELYNFFSSPTSRWEILQNPVSVTDEPELQHQRSTPVSYTHLDVYKRQVGFSL